MMLLAGWLWFWGPDSGKDRVKELVETNGDVVQFIKDEEGKWDGLSTDCGSISVNRKGGYMLQDVLAPDPQGQWRKDSSLERSLEVLKLESEDCRVVSFRYMSFPLSLHYGCGVRQEFKCL